MRIAVMLSCLLLSGCSSVVTISGAADGSEVERLSAGIYRGTLECSVVFSVDGVPLAINETRDWVIAISDFGLPITDGQEEHVGFTTETDFGSLIGTSMITSIVIGNGRVVVESDDDLEFAEMDSALGDGVGMLVGESLTVYEQSGQNGLEYSTQTFMGATSGRASLLAQCDGFFTK